MINSNLVPISEIPPLNPEKKNVLPPRTLLRQEYVKTEFPIKKGELMVKYTPIGNNCFRIVFFKSINNNNIMPDPRVCRTYFISVEKEKVGWSYTVIESHIFF